MFYLWRVNPTSSAAVYVGRFDKFRMAEEVVLGIASADNLKVVRRPTDQGLQLIVKSHATTLEALTQAITFFICNNPQRPEVRRLRVVVGDRPLKPGEGIPQTLEVSHVQGRSKVDG